MLPLPSSISSNPTNYSYSFFFLNYVNTFYNNIQLQNMRLIDSDTIRCVLFKNNLIIKNI